MQDPKDEIINQEPRPDSRNAPPSHSPSHEPPPFYTQLTDQGSLDVPGTLLVIARRFQKLEQWTVSHVRALEERMNDVERWLVDKEKEKEKEKGGDRGEGTSKVIESPSLEGTVNEMRDELTEMQGRIGELGCEMAKFATSPGMLSTTSSSVSAQAMSTAPQTNSSFAIQAQTSSSITVHSHSLPPNAPQPEANVSPIRLRLTDAENGWAKSKAEAETLYTPTAKSPNNMEEGQITRMLMERMQAMEAEIASLRRSEKSFEMMECRNEG
jgi:hypothetical protein